MASGGSSGRAGAGPGSRPYDFGSDDVLCSYDDYEVPNGNRSDRAVKDYHENRMGRQLVNVYSQQDEYSKEDMIAAVEKCMKKYADNLLRFLEGISGRLSQLEVYCYRLERSIGELRSDISREHSEADGKLKSLEKHLQEVHRSVQILRDKQELAETQKELTKLQFAQNISPSSSHSKLSEGSATPSVSESRKQNGIQDVADQSLALALPQQVPVPTSVPARASEKTAPASSNVQQNHYTLNQSGTYYYPHQSDIQYMPGPQVQNHSFQLPPPQQSHLTNQAGPQAVPQYQHQWPQQSSHQFTQQAVQPSQPITQARIRPQTSLSYPRYPSHHPTNSVPEVFPGSSAVQSPYSAIPPSAGARPEAVPISYGGPVNSVSQPLATPQCVLQQLQSQPSQSSLGTNMIKTSYLGTAAYAPAVPQSNIQGYGTMYSIEGGRGAHPSNFHPGSYPPSNVSGLQGQQLPHGNNVGIHHPGSHSQLMRNHPYAEIIEKAVGMGYARDHVLTVLHRMEESNQPIEFNVMFDRLSSQASGASARAWSG